MSEASSSPPPTRSLTPWRRAAVGAAAALLLSVPVARWREIATKHPTTAAPTATYVGRDRCVECHRGVYERWQGSDHDRAMAPATPDTVLGDFDDARFTMDGYTLEFTRSGDSFRVRTEGPNGAMTDYEVAYVFGVRPLQQYLIPFPGGRYQVLGAAWDTVRGEWFDMYPDDDIAPGDWLHWTRQAQNWNSMCADCHSTNVRKGYDLAAGTYATTWSEIDVSCETCHGPGSRHVAWAAIPPMGRPSSEDLGLVTPTRNITARQEVELCAPCHSRRYLLGPLEPGAADLLDREVPSLLREGLYHPDGQILDEVYVYGSFVQSRMFAQGVRCSNCHDVHSLKRHKQGNDLCLQCHRGDTFDTADHHFHEKTVDGKPSQAALCVKCHMVEQPYMVVDWRADHSLRTPRPDLSVTLGVPNACNNQPGCHGDQSAKWAVGWMQKWYGLRKRPHYGTVLATGRTGGLDAEPGLVRLAGDRLRPPIVRATAVSLLSGYPTATSVTALNRALGDDEALVRLTAIRTLNTLKAPGRAERVAPLLYDPVEAVRVEAAMNLSDGARDRLKPAERRVFDDDLARYRKVMEYSGDFAFGRFNLGNLATKLGDDDGAIDHYEAAISIDPLFYPAQSNLAILYSRAGRNDDAEKLLRRVVEAYPGQYQAAYNLGLLLGETGNYEEAAEFLAKAARGLTDHARVRYNLGLVLQYLGRLDEARTALAGAVEREPSNPAFLFALADHDLRRGRLAAADALTRRLLAVQPDHPGGKKLLQVLEKIEEQTR